MVIPILVVMTSTNKLIKYLADEFQKEQGIDLRKDSMAFQRLKEAAEKAKIELSTLSETEINLPIYHCRCNRAKTFSNENITRKARIIVRRYFQTLVEPCKKAMQDAQMSKEAIKEVILVGGSTRIPKVQALVKEFFGKEPNKSVNPDEVVALGAAIQGGVLAGDVTDVLLLDVTPLSLGIETLGRRNDQIN